MANPAEPLATLRQDAKRLLKRVRDLDPAALERARLYPLWRGGVDPVRFALSDAQLVIARAQGFDSWPRLVAAHSKETRMDNVIFNGLGMRIWVLKADFPASAEFYGETLGLKCTWRSDEQGVATYELGYGPTIVLEVSDPDDPEHQGRPPLHGRFTGMTLEVADVEAAYQALMARGVSFMGAPERQYWGGVMAFFSDPGGNSHTLLQRPAQT
ncbi:MAG TPA: VOC family protein [Caulobacteraceae bacterium]